MNLRNSTMTLGSRFRIAGPIFTIILGVTGGILDGLYITADARHLFNGLLDKAAFVVFSVGIYAVIGLALGMFAALLPPYLFFLRKKLDESNVRIFYLSLAGGLSFGLVTIVEKINFFFFSLNLIKNVAIVLGLIIASYFLVSILFHLFSKVSLIDAVLRKTVNMFKSKMVSSLLFVVFLFSAAKVVMVPSYSASNRETDQPNVILISFDTLGAKYMSCYGYPRKTTPNIDAFAADATLFMDHFSVSRSTLPSHMSILTSVYPSVHKVRDSFSSVLDDRFVTLAEVLKEHEYETGAFVDGNRRLNIGAAHGFDQGFEFYEHNPERFLRHEKIYVIKRVLNFVANALHNVGFPDMHSDNIFNGAVAWLSRRRDAKPFFLFLHTYDVHSDFGTKLPYVAPKSFKRLEYREYRGDFTGCNQAGVCATDYLGQINKKIRRGIEKPEDLLNHEDVKYLRSLYDCGIEYADHEFGLFVDKLREMNLLDNTIIVLTSDHGEEFFQHGLLKHHQYFDEIIKVPLVIRHPQKLQKGVKVKSLTRSIDILPTILDLAGIDARSKQFQGKSLLPIIFENEDREELTLFAGADRPVDIDTKILRTSTHKYISVGSERRNQIFYKDRPDQLYNVTHDPEENRNVTDSERERCLAMRRQMDEWTARCDELRLSLIPDDQLTKKIEVDEKTIKELESLGYIK